MLMSDVRSVRAIVLSNDNDGIRGFGRTLYEANPFRVHVFRTLTARTS